MESIQQFWEFFEQSVLPHKTGVAFIIFITTLAQTLKTQVFTKELASKHTFIYWSRRVYPIILLLLGVFTGAVWPVEVYPSISTTPEKIFYFMGCSGISILGFNVFKQWVKKKYDIDMEVEENEESDSVDKK